MFILFNIILTSLFGGIFISILLTVICYLIPKGIHIRPSYSVGCFILLLFAFFFFLFQSSLLLGGFKAKRHAKDAQIVVEAVSDEAPKEMNTEMIDKTIHLYIARRLGWLIGGVIVTGGLMWKLTAENQRKNSIRNRRQYPTHYSSKRYYK